MPQKARCSILSAPIDAHLKLKLHFCLQKAISCMYELCDRMGILIGICWREAHVVTIYLHSISTEEERSDGLAVKQFNRLW